MSTIHSVSDLHPVGRDKILPYAIVMADVIRQWKKLLLKNGNRSEWFAEEEVANWLSRAKVTIEAMMFRFILDPVDELYVDLLASGFPHRYSVRTFSDEMKQVRDVKQIRQQRLELKRAFLDDLRRRQQANSVLVQGVSLTHTHELMSTIEPMKDFHLVSLRKVIAKTPYSTRQQYVCVWERYSYSNQPTLYSLHFEYDGELDEAGANHLAVVLKEETSALIKLRLIAERIDQSSGKLYPKVLCRIVAGPVFINGFTLDDNPLQVALNAGGFEPCTVSASRIILECIVSESEISMRNLTDPHGNNIAILQGFAVRALDEECREREVTSVKKYLFAPHRTVQSLDSSWRDEINHTFITTE